MRMPEGLDRKAEDAAQTGGDGRVFSEDREQGAGARRWCGASGFSLFDYPILQVLAGRRRPLHHAAAGVFEKSRYGQAQLRHVPHAGLRRADAPGMHWQTHKQGAEHYRRMRHTAGKRMDVAVAIGADPAVMYSAILPLPPDLDEMMIAGFLRQSPVEMVKCQTSDLEVPAHAEIVLEGYVELGELRTEGPFGDHTGFYSLADEYPVFHVTCVTQRKDPIYATTIVGPPPMEDYYMGKAIERIFLPLMRLQLPEVRDIAMPPEGVFHNLILVAIRKSYPGHARKVMHSIWGTGQAMFSKVIVVVDEDVDVQNYREVAWKALNNIDPRARHPVRAWGRWIRWTMPAAWRITGRRWGSTRRASGREKGSRGRGPV